MMVAGNALPTPTNPSLTLPSLVMLWLVAFGCAKAKVSRRWSQGEAGKTRLEEDVLTVELLF
jgi:hypothetical protein